MNSEPSNVPANHAREVLEEIRSTEQKYVGNLCVAADVVL